MKHLDDSIIRNIIKAYIYSLHFNYFFSYDINYFNMSRNNHECFANFHVKGIIRFIYVLQVFKTSEFKWIVIFSVSTWILLTTYYGKNILFEQSNIFYLTRWKGMSVLRMDNFFSTCYKTNVLRNRLSEYLPSLKVDVKHTFYGF